MSPRFKFTDSPDMNDEPTLVLLDTGIAISETPKNLKNLKSLFRAIVEKKVRNLLFDRWCLWDIFYSSEMKCSPYGTCNLSARMM